MGFENYRQNLAKELWDEKDKEKREKKLEIAKQTKEYPDAKEEHGRLNKIKAVLKIVGVDIDDLKNNDQFKQKMEEIDSILKDVKFNTFATPYASDFERALEENKDVQKELNNKLAGKIVVDLGSGENPLQDFGPDSLYAIRNAKPKIYIGVDKYYGNYQDACEKSTTGKYGFPVRFVGEDMLTFVSMLPDNSVNYIMNGIDGTIITSDDNKSENKYWKKLAGEISRTVEKGGIITGFVSNITYSLDKSFSKKDITLNKEQHLNSSFFVYEKNIEKD